MRNIDMIIIHCSATPPTMDIGIETVRRWHVNERGWKDVGYHFFIKRDGTIEYGRDPEVPGTHARGFNSRSLGVCYAGGVDANMKPHDTRTDAQKHSMEMLVTILRVIYGKHVEVLGHRDLPGVNKACPSFDAKKWWVEIEQNHGE